MTPEAQLVLPLFAGEVRHWLDSKSRVTLPHRWRGAFTGDVALTRSLEGHLILTRPATWERWVAAAREPSWLGFHLSGSWLLPVRDVRGGPGMQGAKITLPPAAREWAGLSPGGEAVLAGCGDAILLANPQRWQETLADWRSELQQQRQQQAQRGVAG